MKRLFEIDENEKRRILEMHENATKKLYLSEQPAPEQGVPAQGTPASQPLRAAAEINGATYNMREIDSVEKLNLFLDFTKRQLDFALDNLSLRDIPENMQNRISQAIKGALNFGAQKYPGFASNICAGSIKLENLNDAPGFASVVKDYPDIMKAFIPIAKQQVKKLGVKMRCD
jgi:hypothetical protein